MRKTTHFTDEETEVQVTWLGGQIQAFSCCSLQPAVPTIKGDTALSSPQIALLTPNPTPFWMSHVKKAGDVNKQA